MGSHEKKHNIQGGGGVKSEAKEQKKAKGRVLLRRERGDGWEAGSYRDDDALSWNNQFSRTLQLVLTNDFFFFSRMRSTQGGYRIFKPPHDG